MPSVEESDPYMMRLSLLFHDGINHEVNITDIGNLLNRCVKETGKDYLQELRDINLT